MIVTRGWVNMKYQKSKILAVCIAALLVTTLVVFVYQYDNINRKYPNPKRITYKMDEEFSFYGLELKFVNMEILTFDRLIQKYKISTDNLQGIEGTEEKVVLINVQIVNKTDEEKIIELFRFSIQSGAWSNDLNYELFLAINKNSSVQPTLKQNQKMSVIIPYSAYNVQFTEKNWRSFTTREFEVSLSSYPVKEIVKLN